MGQALIGARTSAYAQMSVRAQRRARAAGAGGVVACLRERSLPGSGAVVDEIVVTLGGVLVFGTCAPEAEEHAERLRWVLAPELAAAGVGVRGVERPRARALRRLLRGMPELVDAATARRLARRIEELLGAARPDRSPADPGLITHALADGTVDVRDATGRRLGRWRPWDGSLQLDAARYEGPVRLALGLGPVGGRERRSA